MTLSDKATKSNFKVTLIKSMWNKKVKSDFENKWLRGSLLKWGELKNRKWYLNEHLISALELKLY